MDDHCSGTATAIPTGAVAPCIHISYDNTPTDNTSITTTAPDMHPPHRSHRRRKGLTASTAVLLPILVASLPTVMAQAGCVSLAGSTTCPAFTSASVATNDSYLNGIFPFLSSVTDRQSFDVSLRNYVSSSTGYAARYANLFGCSDVNLNNATNLYARYTISFICNAAIQNSITPCGLPAADTRPLCADACAEFALSEQTILSSPELCGTTGANAMKQLRADFTNCALPADAITGSCIPGYDNEQENCGFQSNLDGLCTYCNSSTINATDSCCVTSDVTTRCRGVTLPSYTSMQPLFSTTGTASPTSSATSSSTQPTSPAVAAPSSHTGLTGGQIAGIVVGSVIGAALILGLLLCCCLFLRRRRRREELNTLNQPSPPHRGPQMTQFGQDGGILAGSRITRMEAMENSMPPPSGGISRDSPMRTGQTSTPVSPVTGGVAAAMLPLRKSPRGEIHDESSPESAGYVSQDAPESEQMDSFKDYYSSDEIHPGDFVSTLWAYQPRAPDEFELERGDMIKIVGIWDDGWATGVRIDTRADEWEMRRDPQRDSGVSSHHASPTSPITGTEVKAFPLVCVCLPQHWRRTIEGDTEPPSSDSPPAS